MASFDFPNNPTLNDEYSLNGASYIWNGEVWERLPTAGLQGNQGTQGLQGNQGNQGLQGRQGTQGLSVQGSQGVQNAQGNQGLQGLQGYKGDTGGANVDISENPPALPDNGDLWWDSGTGLFSVYYEDGDSNQWVEVSAGPAGAQGLQGLQATQGTQGEPGVASSSAPASASSTGTVGTISFDANYIYICIATDTWKRVAISTWT